MSLTYVGSLSIAALVPTTFALFASLTPYIQAQLTGNLNMHANLSILPPSLSATVTIAAGILADLQAAVHAGITPPQVNLSVSLSAQIVILEAFILSLNALIALGGAAGIDAFTWAGPVNGLGPAITSELFNGAPSGGTAFADSNAIVLLTRSSSTWDAMTAFFGGV